MRYTVFGTGRFPCLSGDDLPLSLANGYNTSGDAFSSFMLPFPDSPAVNAWSAMQDMTWGMSRHPTLTVSRCPVANGLHCLSSPRACIRSCSFCFRFFASAMLLRVLLAGTVEEKMYEKQVSGCRLF